MRILLSISQDHITGLYKYIKKDQIQKLIKKYAGRASIPIPHDKNSIYETDYLGLGCNKGHRYLNNDLII